MTTCGPERDRDRDQGAAVGGALDAEVALDGRQSIAEPDQAAAVPPGTPDAIVGDVDEQRAGVDARRDPGARGAGVLDDVGQRLGDALFWWSLAVGLLIAGAVAYPLNRHLISRGKGHAVMHAHHEH